ncbi:MAG: 4-hydroxy-tetrahydrodipicolinate synthase [Actinomycetota bacterium]|nr:4-hydroxy-tetrahydrodipicolinate synthase [Actinomycetota bacterium]
MFGDLLTAIVTPFKEDLSLDLDAFEKLIEHLIKTGTDGLVVSGTTGESPTLSDEEKVELFKVAKEVASGRVKVIAGTGYNCTRETINLTKMAESVGVDAAMVVTPYYNKPPQKGLYNHFRMVAESTKLPLILYNVPSRTITNIEADTTIELSKIENVVAIKEASGNLEQIAKIIDSTTSEFMLYSGDDAMTYPIMTLGGDGAISVISHVAGDKMKSMVTSYKDGKHEEARRIHLELLPLFESMFMTTNPIMVKAALRSIGLNTGGLRPPLIESTKDQERILEDKMRGLKLI